MCVKCEAVACCGARVRDKRNVKRNVSFITEIVSRLVIEFEVSTKS